jgi:glycosyltransferase involved in cell wall biosynthesis
MRVLWFSDKPLPAVARLQGRPSVHHASWQDQLEVALRDTPDLTLAVAATTTQDYAPYEPFVSANTTYYGVGGGDHTTRVGRVARRWRGLIQAGDDLGCALQVIADFRPDLVHVHGTENVFGLLAGQIQAPVVISIQGVLSVCELMDSRGRDTSLLLSLSAGQALRGTGTVLDHFALRRAAVRERRIIERCRHLIGRTRWDADVVRILNPDARYYHCDEPLRPEFREAVWDESLSDPRTVYCTMGGYARKGLGTLLRAIALLRAGSAPDVRLRFAGMALGESEGGRAAAREIRRLGLNGCVTSLGRLGPDGLARELRAARVFALPTHIDNGSNSLSEAMTVGTPCVASAAGGIPTTARDGVEALLVQDGDPYALAGAIARLLDDKELACRLSRNARATALKRHDCDTIRDAMLGIYQTVLDDSIQGTAVPTGEGRRR